MNHEKECRAKEPDSQPSANKYSAKLLVLIALLFTLYSMLPIRSVISLALIPDHWIISSPILLAILGLDKLFRVVWDSMFTAHIENAFSIIYLFGTFLLYLGYGIIISGLSSKTRKAIAVVGIFCFHIILYHIGLSLGMYGFGF
ncbi:hypothetical protein ACFL54_09585 [Planctomycetota bacterium]